MASLTRLAAAALGVTAAVASPLSVAASTYVIRPGDSLNEIAVRHATTIAALAAANQIVDAAALRPGQLLQIPDSTLSVPAYTAAGANVDLYTVKAGEQVLQVARFFGVDATALARVNGIGVDTQLGPGSVLQVPGRLGRVNALLTQISDEVGVAPSIIRAVAWTESAWQQELISATGAVGVMQVEAFTGEWVSRFLAHRKLDIHMARDNVMAGALLIKHLLDVHGSAVQKALAAYYQGDASIGQHGLYADTRRYIRVVGQLLNAA